MVFPPCYIEKITVITVIVEVCSNMIVVIFTFYKGPGEELEFSTWLLLLSARCLLIYSSFSTVCR